MAQLGTVRLGGVPLSASTGIEQDFKNLQPGPVARLMLQITFSLKSTGAAFNLVVSTGQSAAAEGVDDLDILLNLLFTSIQWYIDASTPVGTLTPAQWRTVLGLLNTRDFEGTFTNGTQVPASGGSAKAFTVNIIFPVSLENYFFDGAMFTNGSERLKDGYFFYNMGASLTPNAVLANGTAAVTGLSIDVKQVFGVGTAGDIGHNWQVNRQGNLSPIYTWPDNLPRLALLDVLAVASNPASAISIHDNRNLDPVTFGSNFQAQRNLTGGFDVTFRCTPYLFALPQDHFDEIVERFSKPTAIDIEVGINSLTVYDIRSQAPSPAQVEKVSRMVGAGGGVSIASVAPPSLNGRTVPAHLASLLPVRVSPGAPTRDAQTQVAHPSEVAAKVGKAQAAHATAKALINRAKGR